MLVSEQGAYEWNLHTRVVERCSWQISLIATSTFAAGNDDSKAVPGGISTPLLKAFRMMDTDSDGYISRAEAAKDARTSQFFDLADRNKDGKLDMEEFKLAAPTGFADPYSGE